MTEPTLQAAMAAFEAGDLDRTFIILNSLMTAGGANDVNVLSLLARTFHKAGMLTEAAEVLERAAQRETPHASAFLLNAMQLYEETGQHEKAFLLSLQLNKVIPEHQDVVFILIKGFLERGEKELVEAHKRRLINSTNPEHLALASRLVGSGDYSEDHLTLYKKLYAIAPDQGPILFSLMELASVFHDFDTLNALETRLKGDFAAGSTSIFKGDMPRHSLLWSENEAINRLAENASDMPEKPDGLDMIRRIQAHDWSDRIKVGYVSDDFSDLSPSMNLVRGVLNAHDADKFDIYLIDATPPEKLGFNSRARYGTIIPIHDLDNTAAARAVSNAGIDILVDLKGYTGGARPGLFNQLAAPVQVSWLGFPGTLVNLDIDYIIGDPIVLPDSSRPFYTEKFCRLPESFMPNDPVRRPLPEPRARRDLALPESKFVFSAFTPPDKISPEVFALWIAIMKKVPDSVLWMAETSTLARQNLTRFALLQGVMPNRLVFAPNASYEDHLARIQAADLALDTFPYNGNLESSDLIWAGVPVVTRKGAHFASRITESLLHAIGVPELVAADNAGYVDLAVALATDRHRLGTIREKLATNRFRAPLFDADRFCRHLEAGFAAMVERAKAGQDPDHIDVPALPARNGSFMPPTL
ncbi:MAG TPA: glycosyl transferase [Ensifer sp.]|nr:glycosyl transferase [Ensifer sp.]